MPAMDAKNDGGGSTQSPQTTDRNIPNITSLPTEMLMHTFGYLALDNVQGNLYLASLCEYKQAQKDLHSLCLVSKQMDAVARQYLYRDIIVDNVDVLVYVARTLDEDLALGQHIKRLRFEVPLIVEDAHYRKPNVTVLESRPSYSKICELALNATNVHRYGPIPPFTPHYREEHNLDRTDRDFDEWVIWRNHCGILDFLHFEILLRSSNVEFLCFGKVYSRSLIFPYCALNSLAGKAIGSAIGENPENVHGFLAKLEELQILGDNRDDEAPFTPCVLRNLVDTPSLRRIQCCRDDGDWFHLDPRPGRLIPPPSTWRFKNITCMDLQRSRCTPLGIFQICLTFPSLECLLVSVKPGTGVDPDCGSLIDGFGTRDFLSSGLAKLGHLRELSLNLYYKSDVRPLLGQHAVLTLGGLKNLTKVRLPLHFLVKELPEDEFCITDLEVALPPSVEHIAVWADMDSLKSWKWGVVAIVMISTRPSDPSRIPYLPRRSALEFMGSISGLLTDHFKHLKEATYCYKHPVLEMTCQCFRDQFMPCSRCVASQIFDVHASDESSAQMQMLSANCQARGVCLRTLQERFEE